MEKQNGFKQGQGSVLSHCLWAENGQGLSGEGDREVLTPSVTRL